MGVRGLSSYIRKNDYNFREIKLKDSYIVFDGYNIVNNLYLDSPIYTQYNGEYMAFDALIQNFVNNLRKCNLEPIFVFDGIREVSKSSTVLRRSCDRLITLSHLQQEATRHAASDGTSAAFRVDIQPHLAALTFHLTLDRLGARQVVVDFEADQLAAALAIYLGAPLVSNDSDFFIFAPYWANCGGLTFVPTDLCNFRTPRAYEGGFYIEAQQFLGREGPAFRKLAPIQMPLFATLCGNDYTPPGYFNLHLPGSAPQQPYVRPTAQAASVSAVASRNAIKFGRLVDWLSGFGDDIVEPVERILSSYPISKRPEAAHYLHTGLAAYHVPLEQLSPYLKFLFGETPPPTRVSQTLPTTRNLTRESYGLKAQRILVEGVGGPDYLASWSARLIQAFRRARISTHACDALYAYGIVCNAVVEDFQRREPFQLCTLPLRRLHVGLLLDACSTDGRRLPGVHGPPHRLFYAEYRRAGCTSLEKYRVSFERVSLHECTGFEFLQRHLYLPPCPPIIPAWLHGLACVLFLWVRFNARPESVNLVSSPIALAVCVCAVAAHMRLLQHSEGGAVEVRTAIVRDFRSYCRSRGEKEPLRFCYLHAIAQLQSVLLHLTGLVWLIDALVPEGENFKCGMEMLPPQVMFPSGCLAHHIACRLSSLPPDKRLSLVLTYWLPRLLGGVEAGFVKKVCSMFSGLMNFVDNLLAAAPPAEFRAYRRGPENASSPPPSSSAVTHSNPWRRKPTRNDLENLVMQDMHNVGLEDS
ncbi:conserved hypothetical protein [Echinococcus multilocularis]|uniref:Protein asteroid 1 n=1 Tax=Echinococcus multilocularis TaxID=6211 RepID=A0A068YEB8_ECHMU|nr:conserved hypothetical protein [Echinococcus multilocularis]